MHSLVQILEAAGVGAIDRPTGSASRSRTGSTSVTPIRARRPPWRSFATTLDRLEARVIEVMRHCPCAGRRFGAEGMDALAQALGFRVEIRAPARRSTRRNRKIVRATEQQAWVRAFV